MKFAVKSLNILSWLSLMLMLVHAVLSPITQPIYLRMSHLPELSSNPWLITPPALLSAFGCLLLAQKKFIGYFVLLISAALGFLISPMPKHTLIPLILVTIPFFYTAYHVYSHKKI